MTKECGRSEQHC